jgi:DNA-binding NtrC family response regulator
MRQALILEKDAGSSASTSQLLRSLGYVTALVHTPHQALNVASLIRFDVIVTYTSKTPDERRSLTGELKRAAPEAAVILITERDNVTSEVHPSICPGVSAVIKRPPSAKLLRQIVEFGIDGSGLQPASVLPTQERRVRQSIAN